MLNIEMNTTEYPPPSLFLC